MKKFLKKQYDRTTKEIGKIENQQKNLLDQLSKKIQQKSLEKLRKEYKWEKLKK